MTGTQVMSTAGLVIALVAFAGVIRLLIGHRAFAVRVRDTDSASRTQAASVAEEASSEMARLRSLITSLEGRLLDQEELADRSRDVIQSQIEQVGDKAQADLESLRTDLDRVLARSDETVQLVEGEREAHGEWRVRAGKDLEAMRSDIRSSTQDSTSRLEAADRQGAEFRSALTQEMAQLLKRQAEMLHEDILAATAQ